MLEDFASRSEMSPDPARANPEIVCVIRNEDVAAYLHLAMSKNGFEFQRFRTASEFVASLVHFVPRIVISKRHFEDDFHAKHMCEIIRTHYREPYVYMILLSSSHDLDDIQAALDAGFDDYMVEPFYPQQIHSRLMVARKWIHYLDQILSVQPGMRRG